MLIQLNTALLSYQNKTKISYPILQNSIYGPKAQRPICLFTLWLNNFYQARTVVDVFEKTVLIALWSSSHMTVYLAKERKWSLITM